MGREEHSHIAFSSRDKDAQVLEKDRELDKENSDTVDDRSNIDILDL